MFFNAFALEQVTSLEEEGTPEKHAKTMCFYMVFAFPRLRALFENRLKIVPNALL